MEWVQLPYGPPKLIKTMKMASWIESLAFPFESGTNLRIQVDQLGETKTYLFNLIGAIVYWAKIVDLHSTELGSNPSGSTKNKINLFN